MAIEILDVAPIAFEAGRTQHDYIKAARSAGSGIPHLVGITTNPDWDPIRSYNRANVTHSGMIDRQSQRNSKNASDDAVYRLYVAQGADDAIAEIDRATKEVPGVSFLVYRPLLDEKDSDGILGHVPPERDADAQGSSIHYDAATAISCITIAEHATADQGGLAGKRVAIYGRGPAVGGPAFTILATRNPEEAPAIIESIARENADDWLKPGGLASFDVIICAAGGPTLESIRPEHLVREGKDLERPPIAIIDAAYAKDGQGIPRGNLHRNFTDPNYRPPAGLNCKVTRLGAVGSLTRVAIMNNAIDIAKVTATAPAPILTSEHNPLLETLGHFPLVFTRLSEGIVMATYDGKKVEGDIDDRTAISLAHRALVQKGLKATLHFVSATEDGSISTTTARHAFIVVDSVGVSLKLAQQQPIDRRFLNKPVTTAVFTASAYAGARMPASILAKTPDTTGLQKMLLTPDATTVFSPFSDRTISDNPKTNSTIQTTSPQHPDRPTTSVSQKAPASRSIPHAHTAQEILVPQTEHPLDAIDRQAKTLANTVHTQEWNSPRAQKILSIHERVRAALSEQERLRQRGDLAGATEYSKKINFLLHSNHPSADESDGLLSANQLLEKIQAEQVSSRQIEATQNRQSKIRYGLGQLVTSLRNRSKLPAKVNRASTGELRTVQ
jgi:5,10-methylene-tetrahydrofolate dehydrogenase/methenyl tetrahydrofolate cyclohydrolase